jgi:hypothetical protein
MLKFKEFNDTRLDSLGSGTEHTHEFEVFLKDYQATKNHKFNLTREENQNRVSGSFTHEGA